MRYKRRSTSSGGNGDCNKGSGGNNGSSNRRSKNIRAGRANLKVYANKDIDAVGTATSPRPPRASQSKRLLQRRSSTTPSTTPSGYADVKDMRTGRGREGRISAATVIEALQKTYGMVTLAAQLLKVSYNTLNKYIRSNKKIQSELQSIDEHILDRMQARLIKMAEDGNAGAVYFYLKCKGKQRGFVESLHLSTFL